MRKTAMQKTVDRILRALEPYQIPKRQKILNIVGEYIEEDLTGEDDDEDFDDSSPAEDDSEEEDPPEPETSEPPKDDMDISPTERRKMERNERDRERRAAKKTVAG
jgi:hypothetical protein